MKICFSRHLGSTSKAGHACVRIF